MRQSFSNEAFKDIRNRRVLLASASAVLIGVLSTPVQAQNSTSVVKDGRSITIETTPEVRTIRIDDLTTLSPSRVWQEKRDDQGRSIEVDGPLEGRSDVTFVDWSDGGRTKTITNPMGHQFGFDYDASGRISLYTDQNGIEVRFSYDELGRIISLSKWANTETPQTFQLSWAEDNSISSLVLPTGQSVTALTKEDGRYTTQVQKVLDEIVDWFKKDQASIHLPDFNDPIRTSDLPRRLLQNATDIVRNANGQIISGTDEAGQSLTFVYDEFDRLKRFEDGRGIATKFAHNGFGDVIREVTNERGVTRNVYDEAGNLVRQVREGGLVVNRTYDTLNRVTRVVYKEQGIDKKVHRYTYDECENGVGRICRINSDGIVTRYTYTPRGSLSRSTVGFEDGRTETTRYSYTSAGQLKTLTYPTGLKVRYHHDEAGYVRRVTGQYETDSNAESFTIVSNVKFDADFGRLDQLTFGNGLKTKWTYGNNGNLKARSVLKNGSPIARARYRFDDRGNINVINRLDPTASQRFEYDAIDRLISEQRPQNSETPLLRSYSYDAAGNRLSLVADSQSQSYGYASDANRLESLGYKSLSYDVRGNLIWDRQGKRSFTYDVTNRMQAFYKNGDLKASYRYNAAGQRVSKTIHGISEDGTDYKALLFSYAPNGWLLSEHGQRVNKETSFARDYIWLGDRPLAQIERRLNADGVTKRSRVTYLHTDHLNTPEWGSDDNGTTVWRWNRDAFGAEMTDRDPDGDGTKTTIRLRFPGQYADRDSGLFYNHHRDYDPELGRYVQSDPIGLMGGANRYAYVSANPVKYFDPNGLEEVCYGTNHGYGDNSNDGWGYDENGDPVRDGTRGTYECIYLPDPNPTAPNVPPVYIPPPVITTPTGSGGCYPPAPFQAVNALADAVVAQLELSFGAGISINGRFLGILNAGVGADLGSTRFNFGTESIGFTGTQGVTGELSVGPGGNVTAVGGSRFCGRVASGDQNAFDLPIECSDPSYPLVGFAGGGQFLLGANIQLGINLNDLWQGIICPQSP